MVTRTKEKKDGTGLKEAAEFEGGIVFENTFELTEATELNPEDAMKPQDASLQAQDAHAVAVQLREEGAAMGTAEVLQK